MLFTMQLLGIPFIQLQNSQFNSVAVADCYSFVNPVRSSSCKVITKCEYIFENRFNYYTTLSVISHKLIMFAVLHMLLTLKLGSSLTIA